MIAFFRKIRQGLIAKNRASKYALYAIGEIILVVIGILIAIQLNTLKSNTDDKAKVLKYMNGLHHDLEQDMERINELYAFYSNITNSMQLFLKSDSQNPALSNDELGRLFNATLGYKKFSNKKSTYLSLINDGFINKIKDENLLNDIIVYYETPYLTWSTEIYAHIKESIDYNATDIYDSRDGLIELNDKKSIPNWQISNTQYQTDYKKLVDSKWAINIITRLLRQSSFIFNNIESYAAMNTQLRDHIDQYKKTQ